MSVRYELADPRVQHFLEWLCTIKEERDPSTMKDLADRIGISYATLTNLKNRPDFLAAWEQRYRKTVGSPEKQQSVLQALYETATDRTDPRQVPAARTFLEATDAIKPKRVDVTVTKNTQDLSDDELNALLAEGAARELNARGND